MSDSKMVVTPPIRSIAGDATSPDHSKDNSRERSSSPSSLSSTSSSSFTDSLASSSFPPHEDYLSSNDDDIHQLERRLRTLGRLVPLASSSASEESPPPPLSTCVVCLEESPIRPLSCCSSSICSLCIYSHLSSHIREARIRILCPSCPHIFTRDEILNLISAKDTNGDLAERYKRFFADINGAANIKTCPQCCAIKEIDGKLFESARRRRLLPRRVICDECQFVWCFFCHAPWHEKMSCQEYREGEKMLRLWASKKDQNQPNAQRCPRCKVFISRNGGCPHMVCTKCHCDFCYNCGKRRWAMKFLGSHESRFSPFGCKYNLYPNQPILRHTVRGLVAGVATLAAPVAAVGAVALLAVGTTIGAPTYGTYRLVRHIRKKRRHAARPERPPTNTEDREEEEEDDGEMFRALQASLDSYRAETERRTHSSSSDDENF